MKMMPMVMTVLGTISWQLPLYRFCDIEHETERWTHNDKNIIFLQWRLCSWNYRCVPGIFQRFRAWFIHKFTWIKLLYTTLKCFYLLQHTHII